MSGELDTDGSHYATHHTLGSGANQAAPGNHSHDGGNSFFLALEKGDTGPAGPAGPPGTGGTGGTDTGWLYCEPFNMTVIRSLTGAWARNLNGIVHVSGFNFVIQSTFSSWNFNEGISTTYLPTSCLPVSGEDNLTWMLISSETGWAPRFFNGYINWDGSVVINKPIGTTITFQSGAIYNFVLVTRSWRSETQVGTG